MNENNDGFNMRKALKKTGITLEMLGEATGVSPAYLVAMVNGKKPPSKRMIQWLEEKAAAKQGADEAAGADEPTGAIEPEAETKPRRRAKRGSPTLPTVEEINLDEPVSDAEPAEAFLLYRQEITFTRPAPGAPMVVRSEETDGNHTRVITGVETPNPPGCAPCENCAFNVFNDTRCKALGCGGNWLHPNGFHFQKENAK